MKNDRPRTEEEKLESKLRFTALAKDRLQKKADQQTVLIDELKDELIAALKTTDTKQPTVETYADYSILRQQYTDLQKENVQIRKSLAAGQQSYHAEMRRGDDLLVERGNYAAEILSLKADRAELTDKLEDLEEDHCKLEAKYSLVSHKYDCELRTEGISRDLMANKTACIKRQEEKLASQDETLHKWNDLMAQKTVRCQELCHQVDELKALNTTALGRCSDKERQLRILQRQKTDAAMEMQTKVNVLRVNVNEAQQLNRKLQGKITDEGNNVTVLQQDLCAVQQNCSNRSQLIDLQKVELKKKDNEISILKGFQCCSRKDIEQLKFERDSVQYKLEQLREQTIEAGNEKLRTKNEALKDRLVELQVQLDCTRTNYNAVSTHSKQLQKRIDEAGDILFDDE